jgi:hypothetical protein
MLEFMTIVLPFEDGLPEKLKELNEQGWQDVPGVRPQVIYTICRLATPEAMSKGAGFGKLKIDESKIDIVGPDGKKR